VNTTVEDLFLWDQNFYEPRVGTGEMLGRMQTPGTLQSGKPMTYGLGLQMRDYRGLPTVSHGGSWAGYRAELLRFPAQKLSVACLCNLGGTNPSELARKVAEVYLSSLMSPEDTKASQAFVTLPADELQSRAGTYWDRASGDYAFLSRKEGNLLLESGGSSALLRPLSSSRFVSESAPGVEISFDEEGLAFGRRGEVQRFQRIEPFHPARLEDFRGRYRSEEVSGSIEVEVQDGALVIHHRTIPAKPLKPTRSDSFYMDGLSLSFSRERRGERGRFLARHGKSQGHPLQEGALARRACARPFRYETVAERAVRRAVLAAGSYKPAT
jgi:hypothetical protein